MHNVQAMLETYPKDLGDIDRGKLAACIQACYECSQTCTACADACLSEDMVADLVTCVGTNLDCADVCATTGAVLSRHTGYDANVTRAILEACVAACKACGDECERHASMHERCRVCAESCRRCEQACQDLLGALGCQTVVTASTRLAVVLTGAARSSRQPHPDRHFNALERVTTRSLSASVTASASRSCAPK